MTCKKQKIIKGKLTKVCSVDCWAKHKLSALGSSISQAESYMDHAFTKSLGSWMKLVIKEESR